MKEEIERAFREKFEKEGDSLTTVEARLRWLKWAEENNSYLFKEHLEELGLEKKSSIAADKTKPDRYLHSSRVYNYLTLRIKDAEIVIKMPRFTYRQDALIDFLFEKIYEKVPKMSSEERSLITLDNYEMVLADRNAFPTALTGLSFETSEVRKELGLRKYSDKDIVKDFKQIRRKDIETGVIRIWAEDANKYESVSSWTGSIISDVVETKTTKIAPRTGDPLHKIHLCLGYVTGLLWLNESLRERYCLFRVEFYKLPKQCQKIYRYLSLWEETRLTLRQFSDILGYKPSEKQLRKLKKRIETYLDTLKKRDFIYYWTRVKGTRSWETQWYIQRVKKANTKKGTI